MKRHPKPALGTPTNQNGQQPNPTPSTATHHHPLARIGYPHEPKRSATEPNPLNSHRECGAGDGAQPLMLR